MASWEQHVEHYKECHLDAAQRAAACHLCLVVDPPSGLHSHVQAHRYRWGDVPCFKCSARPIGLKAVHLHMAQFHGAVVWCVLHYLHFTSWEEFYQHHLKDHHRNKDPSLLCALCLGASSNATQAESHARAHDLAKYKHFKCPKCSAHFLSMKGLDKHLGWFHFHFE